MNTIERIQDAFVQYIHTTFGLEEPHAYAVSGLTLNVDENRQAFGDLSSTVALTLAKKAKRAPADIANQIAREFTHVAVARVDVAGAGFVNMTLTMDACKKVAYELMTDKEQFFKLDEQAPKEKYNVEFVSANPTGPLHLGHGRGGIIGDVLGNVLAFLGHEVTKEFYINDAGAQMHKLGKSFKIRCQQVAGMDVALPEEAYHGEYLLELARECVAQEGHQVIEKDDSFFMEYAYKNLLGRLQVTLHTYGIQHDVWFSERILHENKAIEHALEFLAERGFIYEQEGAIWFKSTPFGDDKDRVVRKADGEYTYVAADIAYLVNKVERGFNHLVMILGHDHHSFAVRLDAVRRALGLDALPLDVILYQLVRMKASGQMVKMSKRAGTMVTLDDVIETVGSDVARFFYLNRKADAQLEFDLDLALTKTEENPVYYIQYAYVRTGSILEKAQQEPLLQNVTPADCAALDEDERLLLKKMVALKQTLLSISATHQTHLLAYYTFELAHVFHRYYSHVRVIDLEDPVKSRARLAMIMLVRSTLETCLNLLGLTCPERM